MRNSLREFPLKTLFWLAVFTLVLAMFVILWGAWVRISGSGDGCGEHWPLCHGNLIPETSSSKTSIEFIHRVASGIFGIFVVTLTILCWPRGGVQKKLAVLTLIFTTTEALIGAKLVLFGLVGENSSPYRLLVGGLHFINTFGLLATTGLLTFSLQSTLKSDFRLSIKPYLFPVTCFLIAAGSGTTAALANTLFPSVGIVAGLKADLSAESHWLVQIRILHPVLTTSLLIWLWMSLQKYFEPSKALTALKSVMLLTFFFGVSMIALHASVFTKLTHLLLTDIAWLLLWYLIWKADSSLNETREAGSAR